MNGSPSPAGAAGPPSGEQRYLPILLALAWIAAWFFGLGARALGEPDEGRYAEVAREMLASGDWLTPRLDGFDFFDKPALHYWASAAAYAVFGVNAWSARLWCALTGLMAMAAIGWAGARLFGRQAGGFAAVILGSSLLYFAAAHVDTLDIGVAAFIAIGLSCFLVAQFDATAEPMRRRLNLLMWAALGLAVLSKGLIGLVLPGMALFVYMAWRRQWALLARVSLPGGVLVLAIMCVPWFALMSYRHPGFFDYFFIREHFTRYLSAVDNRRQPFGFFLAVVLVGAFPWTVLLPPLLRGRDRTAAGGPAVRFLWVWVAVVLLFFSLSRSKLPFYILPLFPALALLLAWRAATLPRVALRRRLATVTGLGLLGVLAAWFVPLGRHARTMPAVLHHEQAMLSLAFALIVLAALGGWRLLAPGRDATTGRDRSGAVHVLALGALCAWQLLLVTLQAPAADSAVTVARIIRPAMTPDTQVFTVALSLRGLPFYLERLVTVVSFVPDDIGPSLASRPAGYIPDMAGFERRWRAGSDEIAVVRADRVQSLRTDGLPFCELGRTTRRVVIARAGCGKTP